MTSINGVINALLKRRDDASQYDYSVRDGYPIYILDDVRDMVDILKSHYEISWFTLWNEAAPKWFGEDLGLEEIEVCQTDWAEGDRRANETGDLQIFTAKTPMLADYVSRSERWVWIDDYHGTGVDQEYLERTGFLRENFRLITTDGEVGMTWRDVARAVEFATGKIPAELLERIMS